MLSAPSWVVVSPASWVLVSAPICVVVRPLRLVLLSAPAAAGYAGPAWFAAIAAQVAVEFPALRVEAVLDCGDEAGSALAALRHGLKRVRFAGAEEAAARLAGSTPS